jgi:hypothetical protein
MIEVLNHDCDGDFYRTEGDMICKDCGKEYWRHPYCGNSEYGESMTASFYKQYYLHVLCNGEHIKL